MASNLYLATVVPTYTLGTAAGASTNTGQAILDGLTSSGVLGVALAIGWFFLRRSDERERSIRQQLKEELDRKHDELLEEQSRHEGTKAELMMILRSCRCFEATEEYQYYEE